MITRGNKPVSYAKRPPSIETIKAVSQTGPVKIRFAEDNKPWLLDAFTASAMSTTLYDAVKPDNQVKIAEMIQTKRGFKKFADLCSNHVST
jgi:hypothetical protein